MTTTISGSTVYWGGGGSDTTAPMNTFANDGADGVGSYAFCSTRSTQVRFGGTIGGGSLYTANAGSFGPNNSGWYNRTMAGSWRCMGDAGSANGSGLSNGDCCISLFVRYA